MLRNKTDYNTIMLLMSSKIERSTVCNGVGHYILCKNFNIVASYHFLSPSYYSLVRLWSDTVVIHKHIALVSEILPVAFWLLPSLWCTEGSHTELTVNQGTIVESLGFSAHLQHVRFTRYMYYAHRVISTYNNCITTAGYFSIIFMSPFCGGTCLSTCHINLFLCNYCCCTHVVV